MRYYEQPPLEKQVKEMQALAETLVPYTFPVVSIEEEQEILILKQRQITLDGYDISVILSKAKYPEYGIESLQISSVRTPFLPFNMVCKIGRAFLGDQYLGYAEFFKKGEKVYCWTVRYQEDNKIPPTDRAFEAVYEGFEYKVLPSGCGNLYGC